MEELTPDAGPRVPGGISDAAAVEIIATALHETIRAQHAAGNGGATYRAIAKRLGVPYQHIGDWCSPLSGRVAKIVRLAQLGPILAPAFFRALAAKLEERAGVQRDLRDVALGTQERVGDLSRLVRAALRDGVIDADEERSLEAVFAGIEADVSAARAAVAQHRVKRGEP